MSIRETRATSTSRWWRRHFYHHAGWAQLMDKAMPDHRPSAWSGNHSMEFSAADVELENRARDRGKWATHRGVKACGSSPRSPRYFCGDLRFRRPAARRGQHHHRRWPHGCGDGRPPWHRQDPFTGSTDGPHHPQRPPRAHRNSRWSSAANRPSWCSDDADLDSAVEAWSMRSGSTRAGVLRGLACSCRKA